MGNLDATFNSEVFRKNHALILASNRGQASIKPVRLAYQADGYVAGQVLARNSVSGYYAAYASGGSSGLDTAVGILFDSVDEAASSGTSVGQMIVRGEVFEDNLTDLDADAKTDLGSRSIISGTGNTILLF